jgi:hypothetical protein
MHRRKRPEKVPIACREGGSAFDVTVKVKHTSAPAPTTDRTESHMSFQAYLDNIEDKTGKTPDEFIAMARERGFDDPSTKAGVIVDWLKEDFGVGRGHAMALVHVIKNGAQIGEKHVGASGVHRDPANTLELGGKSRRAQPASHQH